MKWKHKKHKIIVVADALAVVEREAYSAREENKERGGSLVGIQTNDISFILYAIATGPKAKTSWGRISTDADYQNRHIAAVAAHYERHSVSPVYLADYHVHQMGFGELSLEDKAMLQAILNDPDYAHLTGMPVILATFEQGKLKYVPYWITRSANGIRTEHACLEIVTHDNPQILAVLKGCPYSPLDKIMQKQNPEKPLSPALETDNRVAELQGDTLAIRLAIELDHIKAVFSVDAQIRRTRNNYPCLIAQVGGYHMYAVIPSEYPLNPATIFYRKPGSANVTEFNTHKTWNSIARISDIFEEILEANADSPAINIQA